MTSGYSPAFQSKVVWTYSISRQNCKSGSRIGCETVFCFFGERGLRILQLCREAQLLNYAIKSIWTKLLVGRIQLPNRFPTSNEGTRLLNDTLMSKRPNSRQDWIVATIVTLLRRTLLCAAVRKQHRYRRGKGICIRISLAAYNQKYVFWETQIGEKEEKREPPNFGIIIITGKTNTTSSRHICLTLCPCMHE